MVIENETFRTLFFYGESVEMLRDIHPHFLRRLQQPTFIIVAVFRVYFLYLTFSISDIECDNNLVTFLCVLRKRKKNYVGAKLAALRLPRETQ